MIESLREGDSASADWSVRLTPYTGIGNLITTLSTSGTLAAGGDTI